MNFTDSSQYTVHINASQIYSELQTQVTCNVHQKEQRLRGLACTT